MAAEGVGAMATFRAIEIDFDVHKRIELERQDFADTPNAALRRLLKIDGSPPAPTPIPINKPSGGGRPWAGKGVTLPHGTDLRMEYNGRVYVGRIINGTWAIEGGIYKSPSAAAGGVARTKRGNRTSLDGWIYWQVRLPGETDWIRISELRQKYPPTLPVRATEFKNEEFDVKFEAARAELPTESKVMAELENYLAKQKGPVEPTDAYRTLADKFALTIEQRNRKMSNNDEVHWENRVRQARRKLVNAGKIDPNLSRGLWALHTQSEGKAHS